MREMASGDSPERRRAVYAALRASTLILATPGVTGTDHANVSTGTTEIRFIATTTAVRYL